MPWASAKVSFTPASRGSSGVSTPVAERQRIGRRRAIGIGDRRPVLEDVSRDRRRQNLGEIVAHTVLARVELHVGDQIDRRHDAPGRPHDVLPLEIPGGLDLADAVGGGRQAAERVLAVGVGGRGGDPRAGIVEQVDGHAGQRFVAGLVDAVVVGIVKDRAVNARRQDLAEVVVRGLGSRREGGGGDQVAGIVGRAAGRARRVQPAR